MARGLLLAAVAVTAALTAPAAGAVPDQRTLPASSAAALPTSGAAAVGGARDAHEYADRTVAAPPHTRLNLPPRGGSEVGGLSSSGRAKYRYAISVVAIPVAGGRLGLGKKSLGTMIDRVGRRMKEQSDSLITYRFTSFARAPRVRDKDLPCDVERIYEQYSSYAKGLRRTPRGYFDTIAVFITPIRDRCRFSGSALLGGDGTYLNGVDLRDPQHLQDWITAHELGHNLTLIHSGSFFPTSPGWNVATAVVPANERVQAVSEYGDYLDVMGSPPRGGYEISGADYSRWTLDSVSQLNLGVMDDKDVQLVGESGTHELSALRPGGDAPAKSVLAIPVTADRSDTYWILEYRPLEQNPVTVAYPSPWSTAGYGVRLILYEHISPRWYHINKVLRQERRAAGQMGLPVWQRVRLAGGTAVGVLRQEPDSALVSVAVPTVPPADAAPTAPWRG